MDHRNRDFLIKITGRAADLGMQACYDTKNGFQ